MHQELLITLIRKAINSLAREEAEYIRTDVSERSVCARLSLKLQELALRNRKVLEREYDHGEYFADVENNRKQAGQVKTIRANDQKVIKVTCDLILHSRGASVPHDNLIAIEMTKAVRSAADKESNRMRLCELTKSPDDVIPVDDQTHPEHVCGYKLGVFIEINWRQQTMEAEYFVGGNKLTNVSDSFNLG